MATRSTISIISKGKGKTIYCHWDGYASNNGRILKEHYNTEEKILELIKLGNISILGTTIGEKVAFDGFDSQANPQCLAYGRDRGEKGQKARSFLNLPTESQEWNYLFKDGKWYYSRHDENKYKLLTNKIINKD